MSLNDVVISGMSGRFPLSDTTDELAKNLFDGTDMITGDDTRWPIGIYSTIKYNQGLVVLSKLNDLSLNVTNCII